MSLLLTIIAAPASVSVSESSKTFDVHGGTIGRGKDNTWVLDDPERFLSSLHCQVSSENGRFFLTDQSTNGTFLNDQPMGKGCKLPLNDGDKFVLGDYEFAVSLWNPAQAPSGPSSIEPASGPFGGGGMATSDGVLAPDDDPFLSALEGNSSFGQNFGSASSPFDSGYVSQTDSLFSVSPEDTDPFAALDKARGGKSPFSPAQSDPFAGASYSDEAGALNQQISWPNTVPEAASGGGLIPDDWDDDDLLSPMPKVPSEPAIRHHPIEPALSPIASEPAIRHDPIEPALPPIASEPVIRRDPIEPALPPISDEPDIPTVAQQKQWEPQAFDEPAIPDTRSLDWGPDSSELSVTGVSSAQQRAIEKANAKIEAELEMLKKQIFAQQNRRVAPEITVDSSLVNAMGLQGQSLTDEQITRINTTAGEFIREAVKGLMQVLSSRSSIKNEFRMNVTTIQPVENNPLKFSANVDDALENMFVKQGNAYKKPVEAVREGFDGIAEHQIAIIAGIRAAFKGVIERFDPNKLEERFAKQKKGVLIPGMQKARNWELYSDYYTELVGDLDNSFQYLFGDEFVQAYEDQLRKLAAAKRSKSKLNEQ